METDDWKERLDAQLQAYERRKSMTAELRQAMARRRRHGLAARHAAKLNRRSNHDDPAELPAVHQHRAG